MLPSLLAGTTRAPTRVRSHSFLRGDTLSRTTGLGNPASSSTYKPSNSQGSVDANNVPRNQYNPQALYTFSNGQVFSGTPQTGYGQQMGNVDQNTAVQYLPSAMMPGFMNSAGINPAAMAAYWPSYMPADAPGLDPNRRSSWSSVEENGPPTPAGVTASGTQDFWAPAMMDRTGAMVSVPSYYSTMPALNSVYTPGAIQVWRNPETDEYVARNFDEWTSQAPPIPRAVPALWTNNDNLSLGKCLQNVEGITNVYIRGFLPETNDEMLRGYASRFGEIDSCKAIIDMDADPPKCKGYAFHLLIHGHANPTESYGFVKYFHPADAENCIRGFYHLGYQASYAQVGLSKNSR